VSIDNHDRGLGFDLATLLNRRRALALLGGASLAALTACSDTPGSSNAGATTTTTADAAGECAEIPAETAGPFPGDGTNGPNVLSQSGIVRSDIRSSFGDASGTAEGVRLTIKLTVQDAANGCGPLARAAVYVWHCDAAGGYSMYSPGVEDPNYLRGVQETDNSGHVTFTSTFPGAYAGRWPHIHFEVYPSLAEATRAGEPSTTSQLALPAEPCQAVFATDGYDGSAANLAQTSLEGDNVFGDDGGEHQLATVTGSVSAGYTASLILAV